MTIYQITNTVNGKIYIGKTINTIENRFKQHISRSHRQTATQSKTHLHNAMRKYGKEAFTITELESGFNSEDDLNESEIRYISELSPQYNMTEGGEGTSGFTFTQSEEARKKISDAHKGNPKSEEHKRKISEALKGRKRSEKTKKKISEYRKGKSQSEETKKKIGKAKKGMKLQTVTCPYCQKTGGKPVMMRHHYENCKQKRTEATSN
jgi:group I intron endonuclease